jgi:hypothetical protein
MNEFSIRVVLFSALLCKTAQQHPRIYCCWLPLGCCALGCCGSAAAETQGGLHTF